MSVESGITGEPSPWLAGEGRWAQGNQPLQPVHRSGGVCGDGMSGRGDGVNREACECEEIYLQGIASTDGTTSKKKEAALAPAGVGVLHSSVETPVTGVERRRGSCIDAIHSERDPGDGQQWLPTPSLTESVGDKVRKLQRTLYRQAKSKPKWKAWSLYGDVCRIDILTTALKQVIRNGGAPGIDGERVDKLKKFNEQDRQQWLESLREELRSKTYRPAPVLRVYIPKGDGKMRPLGIPTVRDRVVQTAVVLLLLPVFEADFHENSFAYRPRKRAQQAIDVIKNAMFSGRREVLDADLSGYFDNIPHAGLLELVKRRVSDGSVLSLIKSWLRAPIVEIDRKTGKKHITTNRCGTPQGGVISPLLANIYLDGLDKAVNCGQVFKAVMVRYADDFVILCRKGQGMEIQKRVKRWLERRQLILNEVKTRLLDGEKETFDFLGFRLNWRKAPSGKSFPHVEPSPKSCKKLRDSIREETRWSDQWKSPEMIVSRVNLRVRGWINYFHYWNSTEAFRSMQSYTENRVRRWLWKKHNRKGGLWTEYYSNELLHNKYGLIYYPNHAPWRAT